MKSQIAIVGTLFLVICLASITIANPHPRPDEEHYFDKEVGVSFFSKSFPIRAYQTIGVNYFSNFYKKTKK